MFKKGLTSSVSLQFVNVFKAEVIADFLMSSKMCFITIRLDFGRKKKGQTFYGYSDD